MVIGVCVIYFLKKFYFEFHRLSMFQEQLNEDRSRSINQMYREMKIYFQEDKDVIRKVDIFSLKLLKYVLFTNDFIMFDKGTKNRGEIEKCCKVIYLN